MLRVCIYEDVSGCWSGCLMLGDYEVKRIEYLNSWSECYHNLYDFCVRNNIKCSGLPYDVYLFDELVNR